MFKSIQIVGNLGKDPEIRHVQNGAIAGNFSVAVNEQWKNGEGERQSRTTWFNVSAYQAGERGLVTSLIQPHLRKGQLVFIQGDPTMRKWVDQQGNERTSFEIKLGPQSTLRMLGGRPEGERAMADADDGFDGRHRDSRGNGAAAPGGEDAAAAERRRRQAMLDDDIPF